MKKSHSTSALKSQLPISKKAYADFISRFKHTFIDMLNNPNLYNEAVNVFEAYLKGETVEHCDIIVSLAFNMIRPEIDKAISRSASARQRAAIRKSRPENENKTAPDAPSPEKARHDDTTDIADTPIQTGTCNKTETAESITPPMNRRERRAAERQRSRKRRNLHSRVSRML